MTLDDFRKITADMPGTTLVGYPAWDKGCSLSGYDKDAIWLFNRGPGPCVLVLTPGMDYDPRPARLNENRRNRGGLDDEK